MEEEERKQLLTQATNFFREFVIDKHITTGLNKASKLEAYTYNPFLIAYLANFLTGNKNPRSIAKSLIY